MRFWPARRRPGDDQGIGSPGASAHSDYLAGGADGSQRVRPSHGVQGLLEQLPAMAGLRILDLGMLNPRTSEYFGGLGHQVSFVSLLHSFDATRRSGSGRNGSMDADEAEAFVQTHLDFVPGSFHAVLAWDVLQHLGEPLMQRTIARLANIVQHNGVMLCLFHLEEGEQAIPMYNWAVASGKELALREAGSRPAPVKYNARQLETLFPQFRAIHLFLMRDALLEVLVVR